MSSPGIGPPSPPAASSGPPPGDPTAPGVSRWFAALQVFLVSGVPTQSVVLAALLAAGAPLTVDPAGISLEFFAMLSLFDTALVAISIRVFLALSGERSHDVFLGRQPVGREIGRGLALIPALWLLVIVLVYGMNTFLPWLHNVPTNPLEAYMDTPIKAAVFIMVVILAGGVREELQRGFILHRFDQRLGGAWVGLAVFSVVFGIFHLQQGYDAAIAVGLLGVIWGVRYIRRRSIVASMVSHAGFDTVQVLQQVLVRNLST